MIELASGVPPAVVVFLAAVIGVVAGRRIVATVGVVACATVASWALVVPAGSAGEWTFLEFTLVSVSVDPASRVTGLAFAAFGAVALTYLYATGGRRHHITVALVYIGAALWGVFAGDWLSLLVSWELMAIASTLLVWFHGGDAVRIGFRYALVHAIGGALFAAGLALHFAIVGLTPDGVQFADGIASGIPAAVVGLGITINAALIGFHVWLPETYASPHVGVSVVLSAYTTKLAAYAAFRAFPDGNIVLAYIGGVMAIVGASYALAQKDARRLLAYHIQAQVGYMLAGIGIGSSLGVAGAFAHLFNNVLFKGLLFMVAGAIIVRTGTAYLEKGERLHVGAPILAGSFLIAAASITAVPGTNGFVSKGMVLDAALEGGHTPLRWLLLIGAVGTIVSFLKFGYLAGFRGKTNPIHDVSPLQAVGMVPVAVACIALGLLYGSFFELLPASDQWSTTPYSERHIQEKAALFVVGTVLFVAGRPLLDRLNGGTDIDTILNPIVFGVTRESVRAVSTVFGSVATMAETARRLITPLLYEPVETVAAVLPPRLETPYRAYTTGTAGTTRIRPSVTYRLFALACCLIAGLLLGVVLR